MNAYRDNNTETNERRRVRAVRKTLFSRSGHGGGHRERSRISRVYACVYPIDEISENCMIAKRVLFHCFFSFSCIFFSSFLVPVLIWRLVGAGGASV